MAIERNYSLIYLISLSEGALGYPSYCLLPKPHLPLHLLGCEVENQRSPKKKHYLIIEFSQPYFGSVFQVS